eukprot:SAG31_NODE_13489_length_863_cov_3.342037_1_plen_42_part_10
MLLDQVKNKLQTVTAERDRLQALASNEVSGVTFSFLCNYWRN